MRTELHAVRLYLTDFREAEHLKTATVRENRQIPIDEFVQPSRGTDDFHSRAEVEMIGIA